MIHATEFDAAACWIERCLMAAESPYSLSPAQDIGTNASARDWRQSSRHKVIICR